LHFPSFRAKGNQEKKKTVEGKEEIPKKTGDEKRKCGGGGVILDTLLVAVPFVARGGDAVKKTGKEQTGGCGASTAKPEVEPNCEKLRPGRGKSC